MNEFYVYLKTAEDGSALYVGKGKGLREFSPKNESFNWYAASHKVNTQQVAAGMSEEDAYTLEGQLIQKLNPVFNRTNGLSPVKWTDTDFARFMDHLQVKTLAACGAASATPANVAECFASNVLQADHVMLVGDRYSAILDQLFSHGYTGRVSYLLEQGNGMAAKYEQVCEQHGRTSEDIDIYDADDFLTAKLPKVDFVLMNPPFNKDRSTRKLWKSFLDKALTLATQSVFTLMPKRGALPLEHTVLIPTVAFASTPALGQAVMIKSDAKEQQAPSQQLKLDVQINVSHVYADGVRTGYVPAQFIGISRNKQESLCHIRSSADNSEASLWLISGPDLPTLEVLFAKHNFEAIVTSYKIAKGQRFGHAPSINKNELIPLINQLYDMEFPQ